MLVAACGDKAQQPPPPPAVSVYTVHYQDVPRVVELPGRVQAIRTAEVRARVDGIIERRLYEEGSDVKQGAPLFRIDPREMQANYGAAKAALSRAEASAKNAQQVVDRYRPLVDREAISRQEYDAAVAAAAQAQADVSSAQSQVDRAKLDLDYTTVTAPISGRAGRAQVTEGALVKASEGTLLTTIEQLNPIYVNFSQSSNELLKLRRDIEEGKVKALPLDRIEVTLILEDGSTYNHVGHLNFLDMSVDSSTGSVSLRAEFPNPDRLLLPGQFVRARVQGSVIKNGIMVPQRAVQVKPEGASVMLVDDKNIVRSREVTLGNLQGSFWSIASGLQPGDRVITDGLQHIRPGSPVRIDKAPPKEQPGAGQPPAKP
ncbi:MAG: efflux RND transporter periplasmic adaptor subunit [Alphaproteobacteria bacterium]|nr:efflux RND transporter periplasmic adaptor subunit [Alphaproteobacteria bacterium]